MKDTTATIRRRDKVDSCTCGFDEDNIARMAPQGDQKPCFGDCMGQFLAPVLPPGSGINSEGAASPAMCEAFNGTVSSKNDEKFWPLYWCDITYCGLGIERGGPEGAGRKGQDPNVNKIINNCNGIGIKNIYDPGPPPDEFSCSTGKDGESTCQNPAGKDDPSSAQDGPKTRPTHGTAAHPTSSSKAATDTHGSASAGATTTTSGSGLSHGAKIALAVCSAIGLLTLVGIILVCLRRRKRRKTEFRSALLKSSLLGRGGYGGSGGGNGLGGDGAYFPCPSRSGGGEGGYSPTPLLSPAGSAMGGGGSIASVGDPPLTPPLRLRDRRLLLPSILLRPGTSRSSDVSPPLTPLTPAYSPSQNYNASPSIFPPSPICSPTVNKLVPRHERTPTPQKIPIDSLPPLPPQIASAMPTSSAGNATGSIISRGSLRSANTTSTATYCPSSVTANSHTSLLRHEVTLSTMSATTILPASCSSPPGSPPRPPRPHDTPLQIPDLLSAAPAPSSMSPPPTFRGFSPPPLGAGTLPSPPLPPLAVSVSVPTSSATSPTRGPTTPRAFQLSQGGGSGFQRQQQQQPRSFSSPFQGVPSSPRGSANTAKKDTRSQPTNKNNGMNVEDRGSWGSWDGTHTMPTTVHTGGISNTHHNPNNEAASTHKGLGIAAPEIGTARSCSSPVPLPLHVVQGHGHHGHEVHVPLPLSSPTTPRQESGSNAANPAGSDTSASVYEYEYDGYSHGSFGYAHGDGQGQGQQNDARNLIGGVF
ncbi:hypothetical protein V8F06_004790 [Rhypophila decipiens]